MARRKADDDIISTRLRMPVGLHRLIVARAQRNNRSLNSEVLWCMAQQLGGDAPKFVEQMTVEQRRRMQRLFELVTKDPERAEKMLAEIEKREVGK